MRFLTILEVSQKQAYIFSSNKLKDNILNSAAIAYVLSPDYLEKVLREQGYSDKNNMVYAGGGHTILEFDSVENAQKTVAAITEHIYRNFDGLEIFAKTVPYDEGKSPKQNLQELTGVLEKKKSIRKSAFHQGTFGIEAMDVNTLNAKCIDAESDERKELGANEKNNEESFYPEGYKAVFAFGDLGGSKNDSNFIAVVHVDGNGMGKRVEEVYDVFGSKGWEETKKSLRRFSEGIDYDFKEAFRSMASIVDKSMGKLKDDLSIKGNNFPIRRVITAGDDICFVTEGRIGIECARVFIEELSKRKNAVDNKAYSASAGVAIVHQKYPFYKAYELAEMLCSNAKKYGAKISSADNGRTVGVIDWHIEFGEVKDTLDEIRAVYKDRDGQDITMRPYVVCAPQTVMQIPGVHKYYDFKKYITELIADADYYPRGKVKELRSALKNGKTATDNYLAFNRMERIYKNCSDRAMLFDGIELMDTYLELERG